MAKRRGNGEGTIYRRHDGTWTGQISVHTTAGLKRKSFYGRTRREVVAKMSRAMHEMRCGTYVEPARTTLGEWLDTWLDGKKVQLSSGTYQGYETMIRVHIKPALGTIQLAKLQAHMLQSFYQQKLASGRVDGEGGLSVGTVRCLHMIVRQALQQAVKEGLLVRNVADATHPPAEKNKQARPLTEEELLAFLRAVKNDRMYSAYVVAVTTGLRRGELLGLCWDCVDLERGVIAIRRQLLAHKDGPSLEETTKTRSGRRSIPLTDDAIRELRTQRKQWAREKLLSGGDAYHNGLVFRQKNGAPFDPREFTKRFQRLIAKTGLPKVRLHDLRHTHASLLLARGIHPKVVQERLGHASITMTLDLYSHVAPGLQEAAAAVLNGLLSRSDPAELQ